MLLNILLKKGFSQRINSKYLFNKIHFLYALVDNYLDGTLMKIHWTMSRKKKLVRIVEEDIMRYIDNMMF